MKKKFSQEQIIRILQEGESGVSLEDLIRRHGVGRRNGNLNLAV